MPAKDQAREAAFAAMTTTRNDIVRVCREIFDSSTAEDAQRVVEQLSTFLTERGFQFEMGVAGLPNAFLATRVRHDSEAIRKGLRHGHLAFLIPIEPDSAYSLAANLSVIAGLEAAFVSEYGTVTVVGYPDDASLVALADAGVFDEFDAAVGARAAADGDGYCYTIDSTGDSLATRTATVTIDGDVAAFTVMVSAVAATLAAPNEVVTVSSGDGVAELVLIGQTSFELVELSAVIQQLVEEAEGASVSFGSVTADTIVNRIIARRVKTYADTLGHKMDKIRKTEPALPTGWGNVSHATPTFRFNFPTRDVRAEDSDSASITEDDRYEHAFSFATCLCLASLDVLRDMEFRSVADDQLVKALGRRGISRPHRRWLGVHGVIRDPNERKKKSGPKMSDFQIVRGPGMRNN